eukprot:5450493-Alexandrium_andersonii.AAC.1
MLLRRQEASAVAALLRNPALWRLAARALDAFGPAGSQPVAGRAGAREKGACEGRTRENGTREAEACEAGD